MITLKKNNKIAVSKSVQIVRTNGLPYPLLVLAHGTTCYRRGKTQISMHTSAAHR